MMKYNVIMQCSYKLVNVSITDGKESLYDNESKLELSSHKEHNRQIVSCLAKECIDFLHFYGIDKVDIIVRGTQADVRDTFINEFMNSEVVELMLIKDVTPIPHNFFKEPKPITSKMKRLRK